VAARIETARIEPMADDKFSVFLVEDHAVLRDVLQEYIGSMPTVATCSTAADGESALEALGDHAPDFMLIDMSLPDMTGIELIRELKRRHPKLPMAILSGHRSAKYARDALEAGADGYLVKGDLVEIERGFKAIRAGEHYVSEGLGADP
jgi:DNA-binding NarL/FixJ family response regulator